MARGKQGGSEQTRGLFKHEVPKMPDGYYSGDQPNPNLRAFVEAHLRERPYDAEEDGYDVPAFDKPLAATKSTAVYNMHSYHQGKKPHDAIRQYIRHFTEPGDLVLDIFCGSGGTALASLMEGRQAVAIDRSPAATFITKNCCTPLDVELLQTAFEELKAKITPEIGWLYETRCDQCGGKATTAYTVYSHTFRCPRCLMMVPLWDCVGEHVTDTHGKSKKVNACPNCRKRGVIEEISTRGQRFDPVPVLVSYQCENECSRERGVRRHDDPDQRKRDCFAQYDLAKVEEIRRQTIPHWYPTDRMMHAPQEAERWGVKWRAGTSGFRTVDELFTKRNLWAVSATTAAIQTMLEGDATDALRFGLNAILLAMSRMQGFTEDPRFPNQLMRGTYYVPPVGREYNVLEWLEGKVRNLCQGYKVIRDQLKSASLLISTQSATKLDLIPTGSVDYIFTDPPYGDSVQYGELNFVWEAWLGLDTDWHRDEIIVNEVRGVTETDWADMMRAAMAECYRVLKPGHWLSLCYHDTSEGTWSLVQDVMTEVGFVPDRSTTALFIETAQKSFNQLMAAKVTKRDLVINFRKPRIGEAASALTLSGDEDGTTFRDKLHGIVRGYLLANPGSTKDRVYDEVVSRMVRAGQMEAHDFDELLNLIAEPVRADGTEERWYLRETEETRVDETEAAREDAAAASVAAFMEKWLATHPGPEGVHYSDLFEHFVYAVHDKPRRELADWLPDYFYKTDGGTWRPPASDEEQQAKADGRARGTNRRVKRYLSYLQQGLPVPERERPDDATLAEWLRHCKRAGLYEQGKLLYEKGGLNLDALTEEAMVAADEDYQICVRMVSREAQPKKPGPRRGSAQSSLEL